MVIDSTMNIYSVDHPYHISSLWNFHNSTQIQLVFSRIKPKSWFLYNFFWRTRRRSYVSGDLTIFSHCPLLMLILADLSHITLQTEKTAAHLYNSALVQRYTANVHPFIFIYSYYTYKMCLTVWERVCVQTHIWSRCTLLVSPMWMNLVALHAHGVFIVHDIVQFIGDVVVGCWIQARDECSCIRSICIRRVSHQWICVGSISPITIWALPVSCFSLMNSQQLAKAYK